MPQKEKGVAAAPVFEGETRPVRAHPVLPQKLLEPLLQLGLPHLPLVRRRIAPKTVAVVNAGVVEAGHSDCCSSAGARAHGRPQSPPPPSHQMPHGILAPLPGAPPLPVALRPTHCLALLPHPRCPTGCPPRCPRHARSRPAPHLAVRGKPPPPPPPTFSRQKQRAAETSPAVQRAPPPRTPIGPSAARRRGLGPGRPPAPPREEARGGAPPPIGRGAPPPAGQAQFGAKSGGQGRGR